MKKVIKKESDKRKGLKVSMAIHAGLLLLALMPFMQSAKNFTGEELPNVEIEFVYADISSGASSTAPKAVEPIEEPKEKTDLVEKAVEKVKPASREVIFEENTEAEVSLDETMDENAEDFEFEAETVDATTEEIDEVAEEIVPETGGSMEDNSDGEGNEGINPTGKELGDMNFDGDGIFGRRVIYRADVKKITEREGTVVINLCVDRRGLVTHAAFNKDNSSIHDSEYVRRAMDVASDYLFEKDFSAPATQCGKLTFIFHIE